MFFLFCRTPASLKVPPESSGNPRGFSHMSREFAYEANFQPSAQEKLTLFVLMPHEPSLPLKLKGGWGDWWCPPVCALRPPLPKVKGTSIEESSSQGLESRKSGFPCWLCHCLALWPWASWLTPLSLNFLICRREDNNKPTSWYCCEIKVRKFT